MNYKKDIEKLLFSLKQKGITRRAVEVEFDFAKKYLDQAVSRGGNLKLLNRLKKYAEPILQNATDTTLTKPAAPSYTERRRDQKNTSQRPGVPVMGGYTNLGTITVYDDENSRNEVIGTLPPNIFPNCDYAEKAKGDSMYPLIMNQALLVGKQCPVDGISYGEKYIIKTKQGLDTTKFVHPVLDDNKRRIEGKILLVAHNKNIPAQEINVKDVVFSCRVHWIVNPT